MLQKLNQGNSTTINNNQGQIKDFVNMIKNSGNPQLMLQSMMERNPQMKQLMTMINQNGGDPKKLFYEVAKQRGINPDQILNLFR